jgi:hypothetical protein
MTGEAFANGFIELERRFEELPTDESAESNALQSYTRVSALFGLREGMSWQQLLEKRLVVVVGEPGSGKTWEFRERANALNDTEAVGFYIELERLVAGQIPEIFDEQSRKRFERWQKSSKDAFFFLDSVDEAKFRRISDFYTALDKFVFGIGEESLTRARTFISCRVSEWQPESDAYEVVRRLRLRRRAKFRFSQRQRIDQAVNVSTTAEDVGSKEPLILVVQLQPLDSSRVRKFVEGRGVQNGDAFIGEIERNYAWEFVRRPVDVVDLINFWLSRGRLGSLSEMINHDVNLKLSASRRDPTDPLSIGDALAGAQSLAASTNFCREFNFKVPDDSYVASNAIDPRVVLPADWRTDQIKALLTRPIFDGASYGRIRFHHRRVAEYLAAQWLSQRMREGCPVGELNGLLFAHIGSAEVLRPSLAPVAAWLCCGDEPWNEHVRTWITATSPAIHLEYGDPACLSVEYKRALLDALKVQGRNRKRQWISSSPDSLSRLAAAELTNDVGGMISDTALSQDLRAVMIDVARYGDLKGCVGSILQVIENVDESLALKTHAAAAIRDIADTQSLERLAAVARDTESIPNRLCGLFCEALYPAIIDEHELIALLRKTEPVDRFSFGIQHQLKNHFDKNIESVDTGRLLLALANLISPQSGSVEVLRFSWVAELLPSVLLALLRHPVLTADEVDIASVAAQRISEFRQETRGVADEDLPAINKVSQKHSAVRHASFWRMVSDYRNRLGRDPFWVGNVFDYYEVLRPASTDLEWLLRDVRDRVTERDRELALRFAFQLGGASWKDWARLWSATQGNRQLRRQLWQFTRLRVFGWVPRLWYNIRNRFGEKWWWYQKYHYLRSAWYWLHSEWILLTHLRRLSLGEQFRWLGQLAIGAHNANSHRWTPDSWDQLRKKRGWIIVWATKNGCKRAWQRFWPPLPHEEEDPTKTDYRIIVGLSGLQIAVHEGLEWGKLSVEDARRAARYGVNELNGFAPWLSALASARTAEVADVLRECVRGEWEFAADRPAPHEVLNKLVWQGEYLDWAIRDEIWRLFQLGDPSNNEIFGSGLKVLIRSRSDSRAELAQLAEDRANQLGCDSARFIAWIGVLLQMDASKAITLLEEKLAENSNAVEVMVRVCASLNERRIDDGKLITNPNFLEPTNLRQFIPLVYRYVKPADDISHEGSFSPGARDEAQMFRGGLIDSLSKSDTKEAFEVLRDLLCEPSMAESADWIEHLLDNRRLREAEAEPWVAEDIRVFEQEHEIEPKTDRDLFAIARKRLNDVKHDVEKAENSLRTDIRIDDAESVLRQWLQRELRRRSRNRYVVPQEEEIDQQHRPDLRLHNPRTAPVGMEVKWAHKWSLAQLLERLENQLIDQYLRDHHAHYGVYIIGRIDPSQQHWIDPETHERVSFERLIEILQNRARSLVLRSQNVEDILVVAIDFRPPERT